MRDLKETSLRHDEVEALRLKYEKEMEQTEAAESMKISQSTFHRILLSAHKKLAEAILNGWAIRIEE